MLSWVGGFFDRLFSVGGAFIFWQIPLFMQQYQQHLSGRLAELSKYIEQMRHVASLSEKTLDQYVLKFLQSDDVDFSRQGQIIHEMVNRFKDLSESYHALTHATPLTHPWVFLSHMNFDIAKATFATFEWGIPLTTEGLFYALVGMTIGYIIFHAIARAGKIIRSVYRTPVNGEEN